MIGYFYRGVAAAIAVIYTVISVGLSYYCTPDEQDSEASAAPVSSGKLTDGYAKPTLHVLQNGEKTSFQFQQALDLYSNNLPEKMQISVQTVSGADYHSALRSRLLSGEAVDLFQISGAREYLELEEHILELSALDWIFEAYPGTLDAVSYNNGVFGVPYSIEGFGLICNRDIFAAADISLYDIQTSEELAEAFTGLSEKISSGELPEEFAGLEAVSEFPAQDRAFLSEGFADIALSGAFASAAEAALSPSVTFPAAEPVEELVKRLAKHSAYNNDWKKLAEVSNAHQIERFAECSIAVMLGDTSVYKLINELNPELMGRAFLLPVPLDTFEQPFVYIGAPKYWAVNSASSEKSAGAAAEFLTWLYRSEEGAEYFAFEFGEVSPFRDTAKSTGAALHSQMLGYIEAGMNFPRFCREFPENWGKDVFAANVQSYFTDVDKTWNEVIDESAKGWSTLD